MNNLERIIAVNAKADRELLGAPPVLGYTLAAIWFLPVYLYAMVVGQFR